MVPIITKEELKKLIAGDEGKKYILIDVREPWEVSQEAIPTSHNIPLDELEHALKKMDEQVFKDKYAFDKPTKDTNIIFHCHSGSRSNNACEFAIDQGYQATNFEGSMIEWSQPDISQSDTPKKAEGKQTEENMEQSY